MKIKLLFVLLFCGVLSYGQQISSDVECFRSQLRELHKDFKTVDYFQVDTFQITTKDLFIGNGIPTLKAAYKAIPVNVPYEIGIVMKRKKSTQEVKTVLITTHEHHK